ncbi:TetR/AcrR family transcriptional regulator, partial [Streptomyces sp. NPDC004980]
ITLQTELLTEAKERGELLPHVDPVSTSRLLVGAWTGVQLVTEAMADPPDLVAEISALFELILPNNAVPGVLARLDTSPHRAQRIIEENRAAAAS